MGFSNIHNTQKGYDSTDHIWFQGAQQKDSQKTISYFQNQHHTAGWKTSLMQRH